MTEGVESGEEGKKASMKTEKGGLQVVILVNSSRSGMSRVVRHGQNEPYPILSGVAKKLHKEG